MRPSEVEKSACEFEHLVADEITDSICTLLGHPKTCPHGWELLRGGGGELPERHHSARRGSFEARKKGDGPIFKGRFRSQLIRDESHLPYLLAYIHLNPLKAGLVTRLYSHGWTSHRARAGARLVDHRLFRGSVRELGRAPSIRARPPS
jgi:hypothetical protein